MIKSDSPEIKALDAALKLPAGVSRADFFAKICPPLPANFAVPPGEPDGAWDDNAKDFRNYVRKNWTAEDWRLHRWAYARLTERVDGQIGKVLAAFARLGTGSRYRGGLHQRSWRHGRRASLGA